MSPANVASGSTSAIVADMVTGWHVLKIQCYSATQLLGVGKFVKSSDFNVGGHSWHIRYYPDGYDKDHDDFISLYLHANLYTDVEVRARFKFTLLEPDGLTDSEHITSGYDLLRTFKGSIGWGHKNFIGWSELQESTYLKDDCFSVRCDVTVVNVGRTDTKVSKQFVVDVPPSDLHKNLGWLLSSGEGADVTFEVSNGLFKAHRNVLAARSSVFRAELFGPMKEKTMERVVIGDMEARVFKAFLHFVYTDSLPAIGKEEETVMAQHLFVAADRYDLKRLKHICQDKLCYNIDRSNVTTTLILAEQHSCRRLKEACVTFLLSPGILNEVMGADEFDHLRKSYPSLFDELVSELAVKRN
ncbi:hypothetical protein EJB05_26580, partial [Eragrostis curvula]